MIPSDRLSAKERIAQQVKAPDAACRMPRLMMRLWSRLGWHPVIRNPTHLPDVNREFASGEHSTSDRYALRHAGHLSIDDDPDLRLIGDLCSRSRRPSNTRSAIQALDQRRPKG